MDYNKGVVKREAWGNKLCGHPLIESEYFMGQHTGKTVCITCGKLFLPTSPAKPRNRQPPSRNR
jgi:hypothetical protein